MKDGREHMAQTGAGSGGGMTLDRLNKHFEMGRKLRRTQELREALELNIPPTAPKRDGMPHGTDVSDPVGNLAAELADLGAQIAYMEQEVKKDEPEILRFIEGIEDAHVRTIFRLRFLRFLSWDDVAAIIGGNTRDSVSRMCYRYVRKAKRGSG